MANGVLPRAPAPEQPHRVSVLLPTRNHAQFLPEAISSILEQDFTDYEIIASDDASTDESAAIVDEFAQRDSRIHLTRQPQPLGLAGNLNWCLSKARGEYVKFLLTDDKLARPDALRRLVGMLDRASDVVLASSSAVLIDACSKAQYVRDYLRRDRLEDGPAACRRCLLSGVNQIGEPSLYLFRRRCAGSGFNPAYRLWVDVEFAIRVLEQGRFAYCSEPLAAFRLHDRQETRNLMKEHLLPIEYYRLLLDFADRPWLGRKAARLRLFEELHQLQKHPNPPDPQRKALDQALDCLGRGGYAAFKFQRKLLRPIENLYRSSAKRLWDRPAPLSTPGDPT
jgi:glycosyltransferase involved in cell wall biosynthesis